VIVGEGFVGWRPDNCPEEPGRFGTDIDRMTRTAENGAAGGMKPVRMRRRIGGMKQMERDRVGPEYNKSP